MGHFPKCCVCGLEINRSKVKCYKGISKYFHIECLDGFKQAHPRAKYEIVGIRDTSDEEAISQIYDYLTKEVGMKINDYGDLVKQCKDFKSKYKISCKDTYMTLKWYYGVKKNSIAKSNNRIGIVPYVYEDAKKYYDNLDKQKEIINANIYKQKNNVEPIRLIERRDDARKRVYINLDELIAEELRKEENSGR